MIIFLDQNHTWLQKVKYLLNESSDLYETCVRVRVRARIFPKINILINSYLMRKSLMFRKDLSFRWGDIL